MYTQICRHRGARSLSRPIWPGATAGAPGNPGVRRCNQHLAYSSSTLVAISGMCTWDGTLARHHRNHYPGTYPGHDGWGPNPSASRHQAALGFTAASGRQRRILKCCIRHTIVVYRTKMPQCLNSRNRTRGRVQCWHRRRCATCTCERRALSRLG